jgi:hypothetical protein
MQSILQFADFDTILNCKIAFHGLKIHCEKWTELDALLKEKKTPEYSCLRARVDHYN